MNRPDVKSRMEDGVVVVALAGEIDLANAEQIGSAIIADIPSTARGLVLDLSRVTFLDSVGISVIVGMRETLRLRRQPLALLLSEASAVRSTLQAVGLLEPLRATETIDEALSAVSQD